MDKTNFSIKRFFNLRSLKYGTNSIVLIAVVVALAVFINMIVGMIPAKWDLTPNRLYSIGSTTKEILKSLDKDVTIYGLYDSATFDNDPNLKNVAEILNHYNSSHVKVEYVDPDKDPAILEKIDPDQLYSITKRQFAVKSGSRVRVIKEDELFTTSQANPYTGETQVTGVKAEQVFTGAVKYVTSDKIPVAYFTEGHNEMSINSDLTNIISSLKNNSYDVKTINLLTVDKVPDDTEILVFASPKKDITPGEKETLKEYLDRGAKLVVMFDALAKDVDLTNFNSVLSEYNITVNNDVITEKDAARYIPSQPTYIVPIMQSGAAAILPAETKLETYSMIMPVTRSINILKNKKESLSVSSLAKTSTSAVSKPVAGGTENKGPFDVAVMAEYTGQSNPTKIIVLGNSIFASDQMYGIANNTGANFMLYTITSMSDVKNDLVIAPKTYTSNTIDINQLQAQLLGIFVVAVIPLIILIIGVVVWNRRRHL